MYMIVRHMLRNAVVPDAFKLPASGEDEVSRLMMHHV